MPQGMFGVPNVRAQVIERAFAPEKPKPKKGGIFAPGGPARGIAGTIGDFLLQYSGFNPIYAPVQQQRAALNAQQQMAEAERMAGRDEWRYRYDYERNNPKPTNNDTIADYEFIRQQIGDEAAERFLQNKVNPPAYRVGKDGRFYRVDVAQPQALGSELPPGWTIEGGAGGNASGGFPGN